MSGVSPTTVAERVVTFLRRKYPRSTAEAVAADTGIARTTVAKWFERSSAPSAAALVTLAAVYRVEFLTALLPGSEWLEVAAHAVERDNLGRQLEANQRALDALAKRRRSHP